MKVHPLFYLILAANAALALWFFLSTRKEEKDREKVEEHTEFRERVMDTDSLVTATYRAYRKSQDSLLTEYRNLQSYYRGAFETATEREKEIVILYRDRPTLTLADTLLKSKDNRISILLKKDSQSTKDIAVRDGIITKQDSLLVRKDKTIVQLNQGYAQATKDLQKALKPKRWVLSTGVTYGVTGAGKIEPSVGVTLGYKLLQF